MTPELRRRVRALLRNNAILKKHNRQLQNALDHYHEIVHGGYRKRRAERKRVA